MANDREKHQQQAGQGGMGQGQGGQSGKQGQHKDDLSHAGQKPQRGADQGLAGQDTDGDGRTVQPGHKPGQSHGTGHIKK